MFVYDIWDILAAAELLMVVVLAVVIGGVLAFLYLLWKAKSKRSKEINDRLWKKMEEENNATKK